MENENVKPPQQEVNKAKRSASYPATTVMEAYKFALKINEKFSNIEASRKEIASVLNVHDNSISRQVAAVAAYGFADKKMNKGESDYKYKLTPLFSDVFMPDSDKHKKVALITAFGTPKLFAELISKFDGSIIPVELPNVLIKHHGITNTAAEEVANIFVTSGQDVGVINENRVLNYRVVLSAVQKTQYAEIIEEPTNNGIEKPNNINSLTPVKTDSKEPFITDMKVPIHLTKNKMAYMLYPTDINSKDIKLLDHAIKGILLRLELEKDEELSENDKAAGSGSNDNT